VKDWLQLSGKLAGLGDGTTDVVVSGFLGEKSLFGINPLLFSIVVRERDRGSHNCVVNAFRELGNVNVLCWGWAKGERPKGRGRGNPNEMLLWTPFYDFSSAFPPRPLFYCELIWMAFRLFCWMMMKMHFDR